MTHKFRPGTDFQTEDGREVEIYKVTDGYIHGCIKGLVQPFLWDADGKWPLRYVATLDLIPKPRKVVLEECWLTYQRDGNVVSSWRLEENAEEYKPEGGFVRHTPAEEVEV